ALSSDSVPGRRARPSSAGAAPTMTASTLRPVGAADDRAMLVTVLQTSCVRVEFRRCYRPVGRHPRARRRRTGVTATIGRRAGRTWGAATSPHRHRARQRRHRASTAFSAGATPRMSDRTPTHTPTETKSGVVMVSGVSDAELARSPLHARHEALGAKFAEFGGWSMPLQYSGVVDEHTAVRERVGL